MFARVSTRAFIRESLSAKLLLNDLPKAVTVVSSRRGYYDRKHQSSFWSRGYGSIWYSTGAGLLAFTGFIYSKRRNLLRVFADTDAGVAKEGSRVEKLPDGTYKLKIGLRKDLPTYRLEEVKKHGRGAETIWVTCQCGVYDVTDFVEAHPGGTKILLAAGASVEPYWHLYQQHETPETVEILEELRIGNLDPRDIVIEEQLSEDDPYRNDPKRHPALLINSQKPFNAEAPAELLLDNFLTPNDLFFVRNHMPVPQVDGKTHRVTIDGIGLKRPISLSVDELKQRFEIVSLSSTLQCAGNRRSEMGKYKQVQGLSWKGTAISNAKWTGVRLKDVLLAAGVDPNDRRIKHVQCEGADKDSEGQSYGVSIAFEKAMREEVLLAFLMNDEELPMDHGYPLRLIAPGIVGARQVKWLKTIRLSDEESSAQWQKKDYKALPPTMGQTEKLNFDVVPAIQEYPVQSAFAVPSGPITVRREDEELEVAGYAWSGGGRGIIRVEVSADGGKSWQSAELVQDPEQDLDHMWSWTFFKTTVKIPKDATELDLVCKATDRAYNTQPETALGIWNIRGLLHNAWHHVKVEIVD